MRSSSLRARCWPGVVTRAQSPPRIWQGLSTEAQADRGKAVFESACLRCHGPDLGGNTAPALKGDRFQSSWGGDVIESLFALVQTVGCLSSGPGNTWLLTRTADPLPTREEGATEREPCRVS